MQCCVFIHSGINPQNRKFVYWQKWFQWNHRFYLRQLHLSNNLCHDAIFSDLTCLSYDGLSAGSFGQWHWPEYTMDPASHILTHHSYPQTHFKHLPSKRQERRGGTWFTVCNYLLHPQFFSGSHSSLTRLHISDTCYINLFVWPARTTVQ